MARIKKRSALQEYLLRQMGSPSIRVELTEDQINDCINKSIERYSEFAYDGVIEGSVLVELEPDQLKYTLPDNIVAITGLCVSSNYSMFMNIPTGYALAMNPLSLNMLSEVSTLDVQSMVASMASISNIRSLFDVVVHYNYNHIKNELIFFEVPSSRTAVLEIAMDYEPNEAGDNIFGNHWIKQRALGECLLLWSTVTGKYSSNIVNGTSINYADIQQKGESIIEKSEEELWQIGEPLGPYLF